MLERCEVLASVRHDLLAEHNVVYGALLGHVESHERLVAELFQRIGTAVELVVFAADELALLDQVVVHVRVEVVPLVQILIHLLLHVTL